LSYLDGKVFLHGFSVDGIDFFDHQKSSHPNIYVLIWGRTYRLLLLTYPVDRMKTDQDQVEGNHLIVMN
jgi:hypothetical protein